MTHTHILYTSAHIYLFIDHMNRVFLLPTIKFEINFVVCRIHVRSRNRFNRTGND